MLHADSKMGSGGDGNLTTLQEVVSRIVQGVTSSNFSLVGTSLTSFGCIIAPKESLCMLCTDIAFQDISIFLTLLRLEGVGEVNNCLGGNGDQILHMQGGLREQLCRVWLSSRG